ncbi:Arc family DNA-binding protein [Shinella kummerowiae]|uniref:Arc family DNA-binding protein n=1 Tax=Shinella kummerowiae TaxID=417745 RepID=UPI0021B5E69A|nr:Arc family DNA-binding protein [Shinella kummerowiae]MCT7665696.1 Arc family DNA-binding protein [Shinella kummerowiae]
MARAGRGDDQYMVRFPEGLRDRIKEAAEQNGRSMNSEIIDKIELGFALEGEDLHGFIERHEEQAKELREVTLASEAHAEENRRLKLELSSATAALNERRDLADRDEVLDHIMAMIGEIRKFQDADSEALREIRDIQGYLQADAVCLQAELGGDQFKPTANRPLLLTPLADRLASAIDQRTWLLVRVILNIARSAHRHEEAATLAKNLRHQLNGLAFTDDVLDAFLKEVDGLASQLHAVEFYDRMADRLRKADDGIRDSYQAALDELMPKLFKEWPDAWY